MRLFAVALALEASDAFHAAFWSHVLGGSPASRKRAHKAFRAAGGPLDQERLGALLAYGRMPVDDHDLQATFAEVASGPLASFADVEREAVHRVAAQRRSRAADRAQDQPKTTETAKRRGRRGRGVLGMLATAALGAAALTGGGYLAHNAGPANNGLSVSSYNNHVPGLPTPYTPNDAFPYHPSSFDPSTASYLGDPLHASNLGGEFFPLEWLDASATTTASAFSGGGWAAVEGEPIAGDVAALQAGYALDARTIFREHPEAAVLAPTDGTMMNQYTPRNTLLAQPIDHVLVYPAPEPGVHAVADVLVDASSKPVVDAIRAKAQDTSDIKAGMDQFNFNDDVMALGKPFLSDHLPIQASVSTVGGNSEGASPIQFMQFNALAYLNFENQVLNLKGDSLIHFVETSRKATRTDEAKTPEGGLVEGLLSANIDEILATIELKTDPSGVRADVDPGGLPLSEFERLGALCQPRVKLETTKTKTAIKANAKFSSLTDEQLEEFRFDTVEKANLLDAGELASLFRKAREVHKNAGKNNGKDVRAKALQEQWKKLYAQTLPSIAESYHSELGWSDAARFGAFAEGILRTEQPDILTVQEGNFLVAKPLLEEQGYEQVGEAYCKIDGRGEEQADCAFVFVKASGRWKPVEKLVVKGQTLVDMDWEPKGLREGAHGLASGPDVGYQDNGDLAKQIAGIRGTRSRDDGKGNGGKPMSSPATLIDPETGEIVHVVSAHIEKRRYDTLVPKVLDAFKGFVGTPQQVTVTVKGEKTPRTMEATSTLVMGSDSNAAFKAAAPRGDRD